MCLAAALFDNLVRLRQLHIFLIQKLNILTSLVADVTQSQSMTVTHVRRLVRLESWLAPGLSCWPPQDRLELFPPPASGQGEEIWE